jgi:hypothetical protein
MRKFIMGLILGKSKALVPKPGKEIKHTGSTEKTTIELAKRIAKSFGLQSKKQKPVRMIVR